jgi:hypothetical protein
MKQAKFSRILVLLDYADLVDLQAALEKIGEGTLEGEGFYIKSYPVNTRLRLLTEAPWAQPWE